MKIFKIVIFLMCAHAISAQSPSTFKKEIKIELNEILTFWEKYSVDVENGGFYGAVDVNNVPNVQADKGLILNCRILWTFSAAYQMDPKQGYKKLANRTFNYLNTYFWDAKNKGAYWSVKSTGIPSDTHKQVYAEGFMIYAFTEYYKISKNPQALEKAKIIYQVLQDKCKDQKNGGYYEAYDATWKPIDDNTITQGKADQKKSMNTHLHLIEAFANLYQVYPDKKLKAEIETMLAIFHEKIIANGTTQTLFFTDDWSPRSEAVSFGHDIESAWLLLETAETIKNPTWIKKMKTLAINMAIEAEKGIDPKDGGMWNEKNQGHINTEKHWWPQAEAMVGYFNAFQLTGNKKFYALSLGSWSFIKSELKSPTGEWYWGIDEGKEPMMRNGKIGPWKGPYHNGRACLEILKRIR
ncbi:AGE family epimerase/isomerase [Aquirufa sp.]|jgi:mannobiose 2-epimerase|uniref:AGE family epimerase/isomerase n=1 Tax=Aquirufa sp. TaxID=2676249 RepID=UPI0037BFA2AD